MSRRRTARVEHGKWGFVTVKIDGEGFDFSPRDARLLGRRMIEVADSQDAAEVRREERESFRELREGGNP